MTAPLTQSARRLRRLGAAAAVVVAGILPLAFAAGPAAASPTHFKNGCINRWYTRGQCTLSLSTSVTTPGSTITVSGTGFKAGSTVYLSLDPNWQNAHGHNPNFAHHIGLPSATVDPSGDFSQLVTIPGYTPYGGATIQADGTNPLGGSLDLSANLLIVHASSGPKPTTTTVAESHSWAPFGREDKVSFGVDVSPTAGGAGPTGDPVTISIGSASCVATLSNGKGWCQIAPSALPVGTGYAVTASFTGDAGFGPSVSTNTVDFAVTKSPQHINFGWLFGRTLSQSPVVVSATASSGLPVSFATTTPTVCTAGGTNGATITLLTPGRCIVVASQAGSATYAAAAPVTEYFQIPASYHFHHHH